MSLLQHFVVAYVILVLKCPQDQDYIGHFFYQLNGHSKRSESVQ